MPLLSPDVESVVRAKIAADGKQTNLSTGDEALKVSLRCSQRLLSLSELLLIMTFRNFGWHGSEF